MPDTQEYDKDKFWKDHKGVIHPFKNRRDKFGLDEATRDPIFLLQKAVIQVIDLPDGWEAPDGEVLLDQNGEQRTAKDLLTEANGSSYGDGVCAYIEWHTELVFFSREEGERYGKARSYHYPDGWRVYCVCAEGELAEILKQNPNGLEK